MRMASSARRTGKAKRSASEWRASVRTPSRCAVRMTRTAISPRFATATLRNIMLSGRWRVPDQHAYRGRTEAVAGVVDLRAVRDDAEHIHLGPHLDIVAR